MRSHVSSRSIRQRSVPPRPAERYSAYRRPIPITLAQQSRYCPNEESHRLPLQSNHPMQTSQYHTFEIRRQPISQLRTLTFRPISLTWTVERPPHLTTYSLITPHNQYNALETQHQSHTEANTQSVQQGIPAQLLNLLPLNIYSSIHQGTQSCYICQCDFADDDLYRRLPCLHFFHRKCIDVWLERNLTCPTCRISVAHALQHCLDLTHTSCAESPYISDTDHVDSIECESTTAQPLYQHSQLPLTPHATRDESPQVASFTALPSFFQEHTPPIICLSDRTHRVNAHHFEKYRSPCRIERARNSQQTMRVMIPPPTFILQNASPRVGRQRVTSNRSSHPRTSLRPHGVARLEPIPQS